MDEHSLTRLCSGNLEVDLLDQRATLDGNILALSPKTFSLLIVLMRSPQTLVTKQTLFDEVWPNVFVSDAALTTAIKELRHALKDTVKHQAWIQTVRGQGYRFRKAVEVKGAADVAAKPVSSDGAISIAVVPFADMSVEGDQGYFSDGISEEILNALVKVPGLRVAGRAASFAFRGKTEDVRSIGEALSVSHLLEGSVRKQGNRVRISAQLVQTNDGFHIWSEVYNGLLEDVFDLQESISLSIADALKIVLVNAGSNRLAKALTGDHEAHDLYLRGKALVDVRAGDTTLTQAVKLLERAVERDTDFAEAWAELARANNTLPQYTLVQDSSIFMDRATKAAHRALDLDPGLARAHLAASGIDSWKNTLTQPHQRLERAVELDPNDPDAQGALGYYWCIIGHTDRAIETGETALALDPLNATNNWTLALAHINGGNIDRARSLLEESLGLGYLPAALVLPHVFALSGNRPEARDWLERAFLPMNELFQASMGVSDFSSLLADAVHTDNEARRLEVQDILRGYVSDPKAIFTAQIMSFLFNIDDHDTFRDVFISHPFSGDTYILSTLWDDGPMAKKFRQHRLFPAFAERVGLNAVWDVHGVPTWIAR